MPFVLSRPDTGMEAAPGHDETSHINSRPSAFEPTRDMKDRPRLEIILDSEVVQLRGTGVEVDPALLSGHVALYLTESTSIREITMSFKGKAKLPTTDHNMTVSVSNYNVCKHEWSFLEGEKNHSHTLKAGRHFFPFQLQIGGSLPSSLYSTMTGASISYKLRAQAVRPGLTHHNLQTECGVTVIRSFSQEALEYQQTLEIENTWPQKLMYSIVVPHKGWAVGDTLTALMKFCPLVKGAMVLHVGTQMHETTKIFTRTGYQESSRVVARASHDIIEGQAVAVQAGHHSPLVPSPNGTNGPSSSHGASGPSSSSSTTTTWPSRMPGLESPMTESPPPGPASHSSTSTSEDNVDISRDIETRITIELPTNISSSHALDPIIVSHRVKWSILIMNSDGHTSELRCSLPLHILHPYLLKEARAYTSVTRRLLLGGPEVPAEDAENNLPSYSAHLRDRVANVAIQSTMRASNPWVQTDVSPIVASSQLSSGIATPVETRRSADHLPYQPRVGQNAQLEWVNSELLLSVSTQDTNRTADSHHSSDDSGPSSRHASGRGSRQGSRSGSRAASPERTGTRSAPTTTGETYVHDMSTSNRHLHSLFKPSLKPLTSFAHSSWRPSRSHSYGSIPTLGSLARQSSQQQRMSDPTVMVSSLDPTMGAELLHRAFTEVPDYGVAASGSQGGVPPLSSMTGLPSYEEAERSRT